MRRLLLAATVLALLAACTAEAPEAAAPTPTPAERPTATVEALDFTAATIDGGQLQGSSLEGRDLALWFWAPW